MQNLSNYIFICAQPYDSYFTWQVEVMIVNFRKHGISDKMHVLIWSPKEAEKNGKLGDWKLLEKKYKEVSFFYYEDNGDVDLQLYIPQLRPDALSQHFKKYPELSEKTIFYHDCDIIFSHLPDLERLGGDDINWQSNTSSYLGYEYLASKEAEGGIPKDEVVKILADIGGIAIDTIKSYVYKTGGAQYILKNIDYSFWDDVKRMCGEIRKALSFDCEGSINKKYFPSENAGFQSWCADMWAVNFALWNRGKVTDISPDLSFSWATDTSDAYMGNPIYHNAGATAMSQSQGIFYKGRWMASSPIGKKHKVRKNSASYYYVKAIEEVK